MAAHSVDSGVKQLVTIGRKYYADPQAVRAAAGAAIAEIATADLAESVRSLMLESVRDLQAVLDTLDAFQNKRVDWARRWIRGEPGFAQFDAQRFELVDSLEQLAESCLRAKFRPDGYTAKELRTEAAIGRDLWRAILAASGIAPTKRGDVSRRFSNSEIFALAAAAEAHNTTKSLAAATSWRALVKTNGLALSEAAPGI